jgi:hypothetical protein
MFAMLDTSGLTPIDGFRIGADHKPKARLAVNIHLALALWLAHVNI